MGLVSTSIGCGEVWIASHERIYATIYINILYVFGANSIAASVAFL